MSKTSRPSRALPLSESQASAYPTLEKRETEIALLVERFYTLCREDPVLAPVFERRVSDWTRHLETMKRFWSSAIYRTGRYHGRPLEVHRRIADLRPEHFAQWLQLWEQAVRETVQSKAAEPFINMARRMGESMSRSSAPEAPSRSE